MKEQAPAVDSETPAQGRRMQAGSNFSNQASVLPDRYRACPAAKAMNPKIESATGLCVAAN
jgi:hypothetical protein